VRDLFHNVHGLWKTLGKRPDVDRIADAPARHTLLPLPHPTVVPGDRFRYSLHSVLCATQPHDAFWCLWPPSKLLQSTLGIVCPLFVRCVYQCNTFTCSLGCATPGAQRDVLLGLLLGHSRSSCVRNVRDCPRYGDEFAELGGAVWPCAQWQPNVLPQSHTATSPQPGACASRVIDHCPIRYASKASLYPTAQKRHPDSCCFVYVLPSPQLPTPPTS
jgi:hypothetical protein